MQAVILTGGLGTRLGALTKKLPKSMVPVNKKPFLTYLFRLLRDNGIDRIVLCIGYLGNQIRNYIADGRQWGVKVAYSEETKQLLGTAGALKQAKSLLDDHFFLINGDTYLPIDYRDVEKSFLTRHKKGLMVVYDNKENVGIANNVDLDDDLMVIIHNKGGSGAGLRYVDAGVAVLQREAVDDIVEEGPVSLESGLYAPLIQQKELAGYVTGQRFYDIGTLEQVKTFEAYLQKELK